MASPTELPVAVLSSQEQRLLLILQKTQLPWSVNQALGLQHSAQPVVVKTFLRATAEGCLFFSHCFGGMLERDRQEGGTHFPTTGVCRLLMSVWMTVVFISKWEGMGRALAAG